MAITNYRASSKTQAPAVCNIDCCGTKFGRAHINHALRPQSSSPKRKMRRYARHAERRLIRREIQMELTTDYFFSDPIGDEQDDYYHDEFERSLIDDDYDHLDDYDCDYRDNYDEPLDYYRRPAFYSTPEDDAINRLHRTMREAFQNGEISREKYHALTDVLFR